MDCRQVHAFREVLSQQPVDLLVRARLPWALRIAEIDLDVGCQREAVVIRYLLTSFPSQRLVEFRWQFVGTV